ncbi:hypothetical protein K438DRAFT_1793550 [Mycena galopus ATCC 62051]|nr:hypothetical protein K438DRAFT_1793550 [Mycena galopus ATCC 62051]
MPPCLGVLGTREGDDWVGGWWRWWRNLQPEERLVVEGELSRPEDADWSRLSGMYGKNGLLHVMATLCWWGTVVGRQKSRGGMEPGAQEDWAKAVADVTWVLDQLLGSGDIAREEEQPTKTSKRKAKRAVKENGADGGEPQSKRARKKTTAEPGAGESTTTRGRTRSSGTGLEGRPKPKPLYKGRNSVRLSEEALGDLHPKSLKSFGETLGDLRPTIPRPLVR